MYDEKSAGKNLFNGCRYFLIIGGVSAMVTSAMNFVMIGQEEFAPILEQTLQQVGISKTTFQISIVLTAIQSVINVVTGIIGVANSKKIEKASLCYICGIVLIVFALICNAYSAFSGAFSIFSVIFSLILPLLYFWGALKNRQALQEEQGIVVK
ncbi:hypothetical protein HMPREF0992_01023 [Lachnospiraceae bacterium 6_1_63FAA]|nr:hypothetical protein HMPREF0992_01023 [Lachnospiraceae bacterium 6_1_63FAA]